MKLFQITSVLILCTFVHSRFRSPNLRQAGGILRQLRNMKKMDYVTGAGGVLLGLILDEIADLLLANDDILEHVFPLHFTITEFELYIEKSELRIKSVGTRKTLWDA